MYFIKNETYGENMNCVLYLEILADFLLPFMAKNFNVIDGVTHQDNDPKHT